MPGEFSPHAGCLMAWPNRAELWGTKLSEAKADYAAVARAVARFEPVLMVCIPGSAGEVRSACGEGVTPIELPINDSWTRDNGPVFVQNLSHETAIVRFGFNAWGNRWHPHDSDALLPVRIADLLNLPVFSAPLVLEGGSYFVDGEGTAITTEECLLNPNRNPELSQGEIEEAVKTFLGVETLIWLPYGHSLDTGPAGTDGHVDGVLQYIAPGHVLLEVTSDQTSTEYERGQANLARLQATRDAQGRTLEISILDPGPTAQVSYLNHYLANGAVIVPVGGDAADEPALDRLRELHPHREVVGVPGTVIAYGGGGPHCITQQIPAGVTLPI